MRAVLSAVIAAIEAAAIALAVFAIIGVPAVLIWWIDFALAAEPSHLAAMVAAIWQMAHLVPMQLSLSAQQALGLGLVPEALSFTLSLAPLALTLGTATLAYRAGRRAAGRGGIGIATVLGGIFGFAGSAALIGTLAGNFTAWPMWARIIVPTAVFAVPALFAFVVASARDAEEWWLSLVRLVQGVIAKAFPNGAAAFPERAAEVFRLSLASLAGLVVLATLGFTVSIVVGYVDIISLSQSLQLDGFGALMLFLVQLAFLPVAWVWGIAWLSGAGFAVGAATSVTPFDTLLGPLPALPLFGAIPTSWGWLGALAPVLIVALGTVIGGFAGGGSLFRRASALVSVLLPVCAAILTGLVVALFAVLASGSIGPGRLETTGVHAWLAGGLVAVELAFGMSLGVFTRRIDVAEMREAAMVSFGGAEAKDHDRLVAADAFAADDTAAERAVVGDIAARSYRVDAERSGFTNDTADYAETMPVDPLDGDEHSYLPPIGAETTEVVTRKRSWSLRDMFASKTERVVFGEHETGATVERETAVAGSVHDGKSAADRLADEQVTAEIEPLDAAYAAAIDSAIEAESHVEAVAAEPRAPVAEAAVDPASEPEPESSLAADPEPSLAAEPEPEPQDAVDPLLQAFSWDAAQPASEEPQQSPDWRSRMRSKLGRD